MEIMFSSVDDTPAPADLFGYEIRLSKGSLELTCQAAEAPVSNFFLSWRCGRKRVENRAFAARQVAVVNLLSPQLVRLRPGTSRRSRGPKLELFLPR